MSKTTQAAVSLMFFSLIVFTGCHMEQGKLYFDELNLDPITIYKMAPLETTIYCITEGDMPAGERMASMHRQLKAEVENHPEKNNWGRLVCLSLAENATPEQIGETINTLQLVIAVRHRQANPARGFKRLLEQKLRLLDAIENEKRNLEDEKKRYAAGVVELKEEIKRQKQLTVEEKQLTAAEKEKVRTLEEKVGRLQEIELLLHPKE